MERSLSTGQLYSSRKTVKRREFVQWAGSWPTGLMLDPSDCWHFSVSLWSLPYNIKHMVNNVTCSVKHFERTDTLEIHEHGELTVTVALGWGRSQDKSSSAAAA